MRKLFPDVTQLIRENSPSDQEKKEFDQALSALSKLPSAEPRPGFQDCLRTRLVEAGRKKPGQLGFAIKRLKPSYIVIGAAAAIFVAVMALAGPGYLDLGKHQEMARSQEEIKSLAQEKDVPSDNLEQRDLLAAKEDAGSFGIAAADIPKLEELEQEKMKAAQNLETNTPEKSYRAEEPGAAITGLWNPAGRGGIAPELAPDQLPKLPKIIYESASPNGFTGPAVVNKFTLGTELPQSIKELWVFQAFSQPFPMEEIRDLTSRFALPLPVLDDGREYRAADGEALLRFSKEEGRMVFSTSGEEKGKNKITMAEAADLAEKFRAEKGISFFEYGIEVTESPNQGYLVRYVPQIVGIESIGLESVVEVSIYGKVRGVNYLRHALGSAYKYPVLSPAEAWEKFKKEKIFATNSSIEITITAVKLGYFNLPLKGDQTGQSVLQPVYFFAGTDNFGQKFVKYIPAVKEEYFSKD